jgi:hypothetical protein
MEVKEDEEKYSYEIKASMPLDIPDRSPDVVASIIAYKNKSDIEKNTSKYSYSRMPDTGDGGVSILTISQFDVIKSSDIIELQVVPKTVLLSNMKVATSGDASEPRIMQDAKHTNSSSIISFEITHVTKSLDGKLKTLVGDLKVNNMSNNLRIQRIIREPVDSDLYLVTINNTKSYSGEVGLKQEGITIITFEITYFPGMTLQLKLYVSDDVSKNIKIQLLVCSSMSSNESNNVSSLYFGESPMCKCNCKSKVKVNIDLTFSITGVDISDTLCVVHGKKEYFQEKQFPRELIGVTQNIQLLDNPKLIASNFSDRPDYVSVMKGQGCTIWERAKSARVKNTKYYIASNEKDIEFFRNMCAFMVFRYYLSGLSSGKFSVKWLLQENTKKFYENLSSSDFHAFVEVFTIGGYNTYERYMLRTLRK